MGRNTAQALPTGTVTFLFTDIEGSTQLVEQLGSARFADVLDFHARALVGAFQAHDGVVVGGEGDSFFCVFRVASQAVEAAAAAQRALAAAKAPHGATPRVRMGIHTGEGTLATEIAGGDYVGLDVNRAARIAAAGHGGQVLVSEGTHALVHDRLPAGVLLTDLGHHRFKDLGQAQRIYQLAIDGLPSTFPRIRSLDATRNDLPTPLTTFVGREDLIGRGLELLAGTHLLTLTGPGGTGKTRLSLQIAAAAAAGFPDGVHFAALASLTDPALVVVAMARQLGLPAEGIEPVDRLARHLVGKRVLMVLDNLEQVLEAAPAIAELMRRAPSLKLVATSRAALRITGEQEFPVPPLELPDPTQPLDLQRLARTEAVRLFLERARAARPDFALTAENASAVAGICARLDGLPLAIELAAARIRVLGPQAIHQRLDRSLTFLAGGARDLPPRQQTLRGAIAWSYDLLDEEARGLYRMMAWFAGGALESELEAVWNGLGRDPLALLDALERLTEHSFVQRMEGAGGVARFTMLQTLREYGLERLEASPDAPEIHRQHARVYLAVAEAHGPQVMTPARRTALDRLEEEIPNLRVALDAAIAGDKVDLAMRFVVATWRTWQARGYLDEAAAVTRRVLSMSGAEQSPNYAGALEALGGIAYWLGDLRGARATYERLLEVSRAGGNPAVIANALYNLAFPLFLGYRDLAAAESLLVEALALYRTLGDRAGIAKTSWALSQLPIFRGESARAAPLVAEAVEMFRGLDDPFGLGWVLHTRVWLSNQLGEWDAGRRAAAEALRIFGDMRDLSGIALVLAALAKVEAGAGALERAITINAAAATLTKRTALDLESEVSKMFSDVGLATELAEDRIRAAWERGAAMSGEEAVAWALAEILAEMS